MSTHEPTVIRRGPTFDGVTRLLESCELPTSDLTSAHLDHFFYVGSDTKPKGIVGLEFYGSDALLRSLVVTAEQRSHGLGGRLVERAEHYARDRNIAAIYLLTTTAERFFRSRGYVDVPRDSAPPAIRNTPEFSTLCPSSSAFLAKRL